MESGFAPGRIWTIIIVRISRTTSRVQCFRSSPPLAVDAGHPFPFVSNSGINLAVTLHGEKKARFVRIKVPSNRNRWVPLSDGTGYVPLEQVIASNLDVLFPGVETSVHAFRVTRAAHGENSDKPEREIANGALEPGSIIRQVTDELKARKFAGKVRLQVSKGMPKKMRQWLARQLGLEGVDIYVTDHPLRISDLLQFRPEGHPDL